MKITETYRRGDAFTLEALPPAPSEAVARLDASTGSQCLLNHQLRAYDRFAQRYRITADEARILLLNTGVRL